MPCRRSSAGRPRSPICAAPRPRIPSWKARKSARATSSPLWYLSANRDESVFENADKIIVDRPNARRHLAFGHGIHRCVGARLAELQIATLLEEMAKRRMRVNVVGEPERVAACFVHGYRKLPVEITTILT